MDGKFGAKTEAALKTFQKRNGFAQNGIASRELQLKLYEDTPKDTRGYRQYVKTVPPVAGALIRSGATGEVVTKMQTRLKELGYYTGELNGVCDEDTVAAVKMFEGKHGLNGRWRDGRDGSGDSVRRNGHGASVVVTPTPAPTLAPPTKTLRNGDKGDEVKSLQQRLKDLGYYTGNVTGTFNDATTKALKAFQKKSKLEEDGVLGPISRDGAVRRERDLCRAYGHSGQYLATHRRSHYAGECDYYPLRQHGRGCAAAANAPAGAWILQFPPGRRVFDGRHRGCEGVPEGERPQGGRQGGV